MMGTLAFDEGYLSLRYFINKNLLYLLLTVCCDKIVKMQSSPKQDQNTNSREDMQGSSVSIVVGNVEKVILRLC